MSVPLYQIIQVQKILTTHIIENKTKIRVFKLFFWEDLLDRLFIIASKYLVYYLERWLRSLVLGVCVLFHSCFHSFHELNELLLVYTVLLWDSLLAQNPLFYQLIYCGFFCIVYLCCWLKNTHKSVFSTKSFNDVIDHVCFTTIFLGHNHNIQVRRINPLEYGLFQRLLFICCLFVINLNILYHFIYIYITWIQNIRNTSLKNIIQLKGRA